MMLAEERAGGERETESKREGRNRETGSRKGVAESVFVQMFQSESQRKRTFAIFLGR